MIVYVLLRNQMGNLVKGKYAVQHSDGGDIAVISKHNTDMFKHPDMYSHNQNNLQLVSEISEESSLNFLNFRPRWV